jgi:hypothetical protein
MEVPNSADSAAPGADSKPTNCTTRDNRAYRT